MTMPHTRRQLLRRAAALAAAMAVPGLLRALTPPRRNPDRLAAWTGALRAEGLVGGDRIGRAAVRVGELAAGSPYEAAMLEAYLRDGGSPPVASQLPSSGGSRTF